MEIDVPFDGAPLTPRAAVALARDLIAAAGFAHHEFITHEESPRYCILGALGMRDLNDPLPAGARLVYRALPFLQRVIARFDVITAVTLYNDTHTETEVLTLLDRA